MIPLDAVVIGAGAAGLFCAGIAGQRGLRVALLDHSPKLAEKIRISGGGRCNFTNLATTPAQFLSENRAFCRSALARYGAADFIALVRRHGIGFHEKHRGQLFCDDSSEQIIRMLLAECDAGNVQRHQPCRVSAVRTECGQWIAETDHGTMRASSLVIATGGLSIPKLGATDFGLRVARQFGHRVVEPRPGLVPLTFDSHTWAPFGALSGLALGVEIQAGEHPHACQFTEDLLFTHRGLSGPAVLQASSYWRPGQCLRLDLSAGQGIETTLLESKGKARRPLGVELAQYLPQRLAQTWLDMQGLDPKRQLHEVRDSELVRLAQSLRRWTLMPSGSEGWRKAEVMAGGVDTREVDSRSLGSRRAPGLYFIGEVLDVTGWLGGYNFQWAWSSAAACARELPSAH